MPKGRIDNYTRKYWSEFLSSLGLGLGAAHQIAGNGVQEAAVAAWRGLEAHAATNGQLRRLLDLHGEAQQNAIGQTYSSLRRAANNDPLRLEGLHEAEKMVQDRLGALMLFPDNGLLGYLIEELERAAGPDNGQQPGEQALLELLRQVKWDLDRSDLADARAWEKIGAAFAAHGQAQQTIVHFQRHPGGKAADGRNS